VALVLLLAAPLSTRAAVWQSSAAGISLSVPSGTLAAPTNVAGVCYLLSFHVTVTWTADPSPLVSGYTVLRATSAAGPYATIGSVSGGGATSLTDSTATVAASYYYEVESTNHLWTSALTTPLHVVTLASLCL
jgi:hypothetical protein